MSDLNPLTSSPWSDDEQDCDPVSTLTWIGDVLASNHPSDWTEQDIALIEERIKRSLQSEPVPTEPICMLKTDMETLKNADWDSLESDVVTKIRLIGATCKHTQPGGMSDKLANDLILPCLQLLGQFCAAVTIRSEETD